MVAVAMTWSVAVRKPPTMTAIESGKLDPAQDLAAGHAHAAAGLDQVTVHGPQPGIGGDEDGRDAEQEHRQEDGDEAKPDLRRVAEDRRKGQRDRQDGDHQREGRHRPADVGGVDGEPTMRPVWPMYSPMGRPMSGSDQHRRDRDEEVLDDAVGHSGLALPVGRVEEPSGDLPDHSRASRARIHGVSRRSSRTMRMSNVKASATESTAPT